jgi:hypothetical protein
VVADGDPVPGCHLRRVVERGRGGGDVGGLLPAVRPDQRVDDDADAELRGRREDRGLVDPGVEELGVCGRRGQAEGRQSLAEHAEVLLDAVRLDLGEAEAGQAFEGAGGVVGEGVSDRVQLDGKLAHRYLQAVFIFPTTWSKFAPEMLP